MGDDRKISIVLEGKLDQLTSSLKQAENDVERHTQAMTSSFDRFDGGILSVGRSLGALASGTAAIGFGAMVTDVTMAAARFETLGVVLGVVGKNSGYTTSQMVGYAEGVAQMGISNEAARSTVVQMASAHIDLTKAQNLARIAQDAAVIGNINSSEAFEKMIYGIQSGQIDVLKTIGINVNFETSYKKIALELGKTKDSLSETEKMTARTNAVMEKGRDIAGAYEGAMSTVGKQVNSLKRYHDNLKVSIGEAFTPAAALLIQDYTLALKGLYKIIEDRKKDGGGEGDSLLAGVYKTIRLSGNEAMAQMDVIMAEYSKYKQVLGAVGKNSPLGNGPRTRQLFEEMQYQGAGEMEQYQRDFWKRQGAINSAAAAAAAPGPVLDPSESARLQMMKDRLVVDRSKEKPPPKTDKKAESLAESWKRELIGVQAITAEAADGFSPWDKAIEEANRKAELLLAKFGKVRGAASAIEEMRSALIAKPGNDAAKQMNLDEIDGRMKSESWMNYMGKLSDAQQKTFDGSAARSGWAAEQLKSDKTSDRQGILFAGAQVSLDGDTSQVKLDQIKIEEDGWIQSWAMMTDSFEVFEARKTQIEAMSATKRVALTRSEQQVKLGLIASGAGQTGDMMLQLHNLLGKQDKAAFRAFQAAKAAETIVSTYSGIALQWSDTTAGSFYERLAHTIAVGTSGTMSLAAIWAADPEGGSGSSSPGSGGSAGNVTSPGGAYNPIVTQPLSPAASSPISITVQIQGNVISDDRWVEERLAPAIRDLAVNRNVSFGFTPSS